MKGIVISELQNNRFATQPTFLHVLLSPLFSLFSLRHGKAARVRETLTYICHISSRCCCCCCFSTSINSSKFSSTFTLSYSTILHFTLTLHAFVCTVYNFSFLFSCHAVYDFFSYYVHIHQHVHDAFSSPFNVTRSHLHSKITPAPFDTYTYMLASRAAVATNWWESERERECVKKRQTNHMISTQRFLSSSDKSTSTGVYSFHLC